ncbi:hypothetical protein ACQUFY_21285 [Robbsia andropogonis]|uniref:hypothetical protein n=1 Tax=Robbsia andropogonis TaxID=28092 RepID=UPI003D198BB3
MSKEIRILTGFHAGARIKLITPTMSIGAHPGADILITDWSEVGMQVTTDAQENVFIGTPEGGGDSPMVDFAPERFGQIALCAGPTDGHWPSDLELMDVMLGRRREGRKYEGESSDGVYPAGPTVPQITVRRRVPWLHTGVAALLVGSIGAAAVLLPGGKAPMAADNAPSRVTLTDVKRVLAQSNLSGLTVIPQADGFSVMGITSNSAETGKAHAALLALIGNRLDWRVRSGDVIASALEESLHQANVHVQYVGDNRFEVTGTARDPSYTRNVAARFRGDMAPLTAHIDVNVVRADELADAGGVDSALSADNVQYVEASDGTKIFEAKAAGNVTLH